MIAAALLAAIPAQAADAGSAHRLQCWADAKGQRVCGDAVPPDVVRRERELINRQGIVQKVLPAEKSPEQLAEEARQRDERERQQTYDRYLVQAYQNVGEIERVRDDRLAAIEGRLALANKALVDNTAALATLHEREREITAAKQAVPPGLSRQLAEFAKAADENRRAIARIEQERIDVGSQFQRDIQRYRLLAETAGSQAAR